MSADPHARSPRARWAIVIVVALSLLGAISATGGLLSQGAAAAEATVGIYSGTEVVAGAGADDDDPVELGVRFTVTTSGSIEAIRFYKNSGNTGVHTGSLWSSSGRLLASVTFANETATGWQVAKLPSPVPVRVGRTYVASYHTDSGRYAAKVGVFANGATLGDGAIRGTAGVYRYGASGLPTSTWQGAGYFVDALFRPETGATSPSPTATATTPPPPPTSASPTMSPSPSPTNTSPTTSPSPTSPGPSSPSSCNRNGAYVWSNLSTCGWPGPDNTGYELSSCPSGLAVNSGSASRTVRLTTANAVISCQNITGCLSIEAQNVTIRNVKVTCTSGRTGESANGTSVIRVGNGASATIDRVEVNGMSGVHACVWHQGKSLIVNGVNCYGANDGVFSWADTSYSSTTGDNFTIRDSYFHDFTTKTANGHIDGYQTEGAGNGLIEHNTYLMTSDDNNDSDSAIAIWNGIRSSHDITVRGNLIAGGGFAIYAQDYHPSGNSPTGGYSVTDIVFVDNVFSTRLYGCVGTWGVWFTRGQPTDGWNRDGNSLLESGADLDQTNPTYQGRVCS